MSAPAPSRPVPPAFAQARARIAQGDAAGAAAALGESIRDAPGFLPAHLDLATLLARRGDPGSALAVLSRALALSATDPEARARVASAFAALLAPLRPKHHEPRLAADVVACLREEGAHRQALAPLAARLLLLASPDPAAAAADPLWAAFLTHCLNVDPAMETRLAAWRGTLLRRHVGGEPARPELAALLALQAFAGEYVWPATPAERDALAKLAGEEDAGSLLLRAMYAPLIDLVDPAGRWEDLLVDRAGEAGRTLVRRTLRDPMRERALAVTLAELPGTGANATSATVRDQYEANPYPRWQAAPRPPRLSIRALVESLPGIDRRALPAEIARVLVAGCGTGYEAIDLARVDPDLHVTGLDLSRASLGYTRRKVQELQVANVDLVRGDLLDLPAADARYDLVTATGVLHHLASPAAGLDALRRVTAPGGVLRLGLYSRRARAAIETARAGIAARGWRAPDDVRAFRALVLSLPQGAPLAALRQSEDFYSVSGCRDLVFHPCEHRFTPPEIGALLDGARLRLVGFDAPPAAATLLGDGDPLDLARWDAIEADHPTLFAGMFQFWCQTVS